MTILQTGQPCHYAPSLLKQLGDESRRVLSPFLIILAVAILGVVLWLAHGDTGNLGEKPCDEGG